MMEFIKAGQLDPDIAMECMTARSMTELKSKLSVAFQKRRDEVQNTQQLQQQLEELQKQLDRASQEKEKLMNAMVQVVMNFVIQKTRLETRVTKPNQNLEVSPLKCWMVLGSLESDRSSQVEFVSSLSS